MVFHIIITDKGEFKAVADINAENAIEAAIIAEQLYDIYNQRHCVFDCKNCENKDCPLKNKNIMFNHIE